MTDLLLSHDIVPGAAGYTESSRIAHAYAKGRFVRAWGTGSRITSGQLSKAEGKGIWKAWDRMATLSPDLLDKLEALGVEHPGSYADCYHELAPKLQPVKHTYNALFSWWPGGPWEEAVQRGTHHGKYYRYDLVSAYRWAATLGLPDTRTFKMCWHARPHDVNGLWVARIQSRADLPYTLRYAGDNLVVISSEELRAYGIKADVIRGVTWTDQTDAAYVERTLTQLPCAKESGRAYWGRWICRDPLRNYTSAKTWDLPNRLANFVWGWLIVGRVRTRVWQSAQDAVHIYVDEVVSPYIIPTGNNIGDWHLKETYERGVTVRRTGHYYALGDESRTAMRTGVSWQAA